MCMVNLFKSLLKADPNQLEARLANGLVMGHAYSITSVILVCTFLSPKPKILTFNTNDKFLLNDDLQSWVCSIAMVDMFMTDGH